MDGGGGLHGAIDPGQHAIDVSTGGDALGADVEAQADQLLVLGGERVPKIAKTRGAEIGEGQLGAVSVVEQAREAGAPSQAGCFAGIVGESIGED